MEHFQCAIVDHHIRIFGLALTYLSKCGREITMEVTPSAVRCRFSATRDTRTCTCLRMMLHGCCECATLTSQIVLRALNDTKSQFASVTLNSRTS